MINIKIDDILLPFACVFWVAIMLTQGAIGSPVLLIFGVVYIFMYITSHSNPSKSVHSVKRWLSYLSILGTLFWMVASKGIVSESPLAAVYFFTLPVIALFASIFINMLLNR